MRLAAILLAAGRSVRFGPEDKLAAPYRGRPLVTHAADALLAMAPDIRIAVTRSDAISALLQGFETVSPESGDLQSSSFRAGIRAALNHNASHALIALGDMPGIDVQLLHHIVQRTTPDLAAAASDGDRPQPPVCLPKSLFGQALEASGDQGARALISALPRDQWVAARQDQLRDIDTPSDLI